MAEWEIKKTLGRCYGSGRQLAVGEEYYAALVPVQGGLERRDFSAEFWEAQKPEVYCFWKSHVPNPQLKPKLFVDDTMLMAFFDRLATETETEKLNFRFVLMLVLMRKRKLKYDSSRKEEGREIWLLRVVGEDRTEEVVNPNLSEDQIGRLSEQMGQILQANLEES